MPIKIELKDIPTASLPTAGDKVLIAYGPSGLGRLLPLSLLPSVDQLILCQENGLIYQIVVSIVDGQPSIGLQQVTSPTSAPVLVLCTDNGNTYQIEAILVDGVPTITLTQIA